MGIIGLGYGGWIPVNLFNFSNDRLVNISYPSSINFQYNMPQMERCLNIIPSQSIHTNEFYSNLKMCYSTSLLSEMRVDKKLKNYKGESSVVR